MSEIDEINKMLNSREYAEKLLRIAIASIKPEDFKNAMEKNLEPSKLILNEFHKYTENPAIKPLIQLVFRKYWSVIEDYLIHPQKVLNLLWEENPKLRDILKEDRAKRYIYLACAGAYVKLYYWVWYGKNMYLEAK